MMKPQNAIVGHWSARAGQESHTIESILDRVWSLCRLPTQPSQETIPTKQARQSQRYGRVCMACASLFSASKHCKRAACNPVCESELKREAMLRSGQSDRLRAVARRSKPQIGCAACLHTVGFGFKWIKKLVGIIPPKWARTAAHDPMRFNRQRTATLLASGTSFRQREALRVARLTAAVPWLAAWFAQHHKETEAWLAELKKRKMSRATARQMERYRTDPAFKVKFTLRKQLRKFVSGECKVDRKDMFGCTIKHLVQHLENQFERGMKWSNHGEWHIDHILPCASFNLMDVEEQKKCFHWTNLRPMWACENMSKSDKISGAQLGLMLTIQ